LRAPIVVWLRLAAGVLAAAAAGVLAASAAPSRVSAPSTIAYAVEFALPPEQPSRGGRTYGGICLARLDGRGSFRVTALADDRGPAWSPDGRFLAFSRQSDYSKPNTNIFDIHVLDVARHTSRWLTSRGSEGIGEFNWDAAWSPDGRLLAHGFGWRGSGIAVRDLGSGRVREIATFPPDVRAADFAWSPDGRLIAFTTGPGPGRPSIHVIPASGGHSSLLVADASEPAWSPDGRHLAYVNLQGDLVVAAADGTGPRTVAVTPERESGPAWSPDGRLLAFARELGSGGAIVVARPDGSNERVVVRSRFRVYEPAWRPGGGHGSRPPCIRSGTARADVMRGTRFPDLMLGNGGDDRLLGAGGADVIDGGPGADLIDGGAGNDLLRGGPGRDRVFGRPGDDTIEVADGQRDVVSCGAGRDRVLADRIDVVAHDCETVVRR
jgi:Tol biopolymer transport system component